MVYRDYFKGVNIITPDYMDSGHCGAGTGVAWELTRGTGLARETVYGVTFRRINNVKVKVNGRDPSALCYSLREARAYIEATAREIRVAVAKGEALTEATT